MTLYLSSATSGLLGFDLFGEFYGYTGLKLYKTKTEAYFIDSPKILWYIEVTLLVLLGR